MSQYCLLITKTVLTNLSKDSSGHYSRLRMLIEAAKATGVPPHIFCLDQVSDIKANEVELAKKISNEIQNVWGVECKVIVGRTNRFFNVSRSFDQVFGVIYNWLFPLLPLLDKATKIKLAKEIENQPLFIIAHKIFVMSLLFGFKTKKIPIFFDLDDVEHLILRRKIKYITSKRGKIFSWLSLPGLIWMEALTTSKAKYTLVCSKNDAKTMSQLFRYSKMFVLPNAVEMPLIENPLVNSQIILMVGLYSYGPNMDAAEYFISEIFPIIRNENPNAEVWFVGGGAQSAHCFNNNVTGVHYLGFVDDLEAVYKQARVVICPVRYGTGTRVKLIEAAAWEKAIVTTGLGAEGLDMIHNDHALFSDTPIGFAQHCLTLLEDDSLCLMLGKNARKLAEGTYDRRTIVQKLAIELIKK